MEKKFTTLLVILGTQVMGTLSGFIVVCLVNIWPASSLALELRDARHLLARTGFGLPRPKEIEALRELTRGEAIESLLNSIGTEALTPPPSWVDEPMPAWKVRKTWLNSRKRLFNKRNRERWHELQGWWASEMLSTPTPITERLVLFWHNHFTVSFESVKWVPLLYNQNLTIRRLAAGNFRDLLTAMVTDPAMLFYLDGRRNRAKKPNENFAREFLELFTMGEGQSYNEQDIREAARAFSGWTVNLQSLRPVFRPKYHDHGEKVFLARSGSFNSDDIVEIILDNSRPAKYIAERFYQAFVGEPLDGRTIEAIARDFRASNYSIRVLLRSLLNSQPFWSDRNRGNQIKSPVDMVVGLARLSGWQGDIEVLVKRMNGMGQQLFRPPNVKGWRGGAAWISSIWLRKRNGFIKTLTKVFGRRGGDMGGVEHMANGMHLLMVGNGRSPDETEAIVLAVPPVQEVSLDRLSPTAHLTALLLDPAFQMK